MASAVMDVLKSTPEAVEEAPKAAARFTKTITMNLASTSSFLHAFIAILFFSAFITAQAQTSRQSADLSSEKPDQSELLTVLIDEIRGLRLAVEQNSLLQYRSNLLLARLRHQEETIHETSGELREVEKNLFELNRISRYDEQIDNLRDFESQMNEATDPKIRQELTHEYDVLKRKLERQKRSDKEQIERARALKPKLEDKLREQLDLLGDLKFQLDSLEQEIEARIRKTTTQRPGVETATKQQ